MGGQNRLVLMTGANNFGVLGNSLSFRFKGSKKANYLRITLNSMDTYDLEFGKVHGTNYKVVKTLTYIYSDQLIEIFENTTGLMLSL